MGQPGEFYYVSRLLLTDVTHFLIWGSGDSEYGAVTASVK